jgi:formate-dependent nitrite reductase membrane component NrfD
MRELTITGINEITYPNLDIWGWEVALYLFLGGLTAGIMVMSAIANLRKSKELPDDVACCIKAPMYAPILLAIGMFFLWLDLTRKFNVFWFYLSFQPLSPMSWGAWGLVLMFPVSFAFALSVVPPEKKDWLRFEILKNWSNKLYPYMRKLAILNLALGIFLGIYTGVLLSSFVARPLWNSSILPILFLNSALSTGAAFCVIMAKRTSVRLFFTKVDIWLIIAELVLLALFFYGHYTSTAPHRESIMPLFSFTGKYFIYGIASIMIWTSFALALVLKLLEVKEEHGDALSSSQIFRMRLSAVLVLIGALIIRLAFVYAGQLTKLS